MYKMLFLPLCFIQKMHSSPHYDRERKKVGQGDNLVVFADLAGLVSDIIQKDHVLGCSLTQHFLV